MGKPPPAAEFATMNHPIRNAGMPLDLSLLEAIRVNQNAVARRVSSLNARRSQKKEYQAAWLVRAIACMDLTTLSGDDMLTACPDGASPIFTPSSLTTPTV